MIKKSKNRIVLADLSEIKRIIRKEVLNAISDYENRKEKNYRVFSVHAAAKQIGISDKTIKDMVKNGLLKSTPDGKITEQSIQEYHENLTKGGRKDG